jgi:hypothetical protein
MRAPRLPSPGLLHQACHATGVRRFRAFKPPGKLSGRAPAFERMPIERAPPSVSRIREFITASIRSAATRTVG